MKPIETMKMVRKAIELLTSGKQYTRVELFPAAMDRHLQKRVLDRLVEEEVLSKAEVGSESSVVIKYKAQDLEELHLFLTSDSLLVKLIWPNDPPEEVMPKPADPPPAVNPIVAARLPPPKHTPMPIDPPTRPVPTLVKPVPTEPFQGPDGKQYVWVADGNKMKAELYTPPVEEMDEKALLARQVILLDALMESIVYMRDQQDEMKRELTALRKDLGG